MNIGYNIKLIKSYLLSVTTKKHFIDALLCRQLKTNIGTSSNFVFKLILVASNR